MRKYTGVIVSWLGGLLLLVSIIAVPLTVLPIYTLVLGRAWSIVLLVSGIGGVLAGRAIFDAGRRLAQETAAVRLAMDRRPPVLLLRAFSADGEVAERNWFTQRSLFGWMFGRATFEERLATIMENLGPPVALGRTGEVLAKFGFAREYVDDLRWRRVVDDYLKRSSWVVILIQRLTPNLIYEIQRSLTFGPTLKVLLIPPPLRLRTKAWYAAWSDLASSIPLLPTITELTAAVIVDPKRGGVAVTAPSGASADAQLSSIQRELIPRYLLCDS